MSIVALKRKAAAKYGKISSSRYSKDGFSLNNPRRVESKSGKDQYQTPMRGNAPRGHGQKLGHYPVKIVKSQYTNSDEFVRSVNGNQGISVKNNSASISTRNKWMKRGYPHYWVQPMSENGYDIVLKQKKEQIAKSETGRVASETGICPCNKNRTNLDGTGITKRVDTMSQSEYLSTGLMTKNCLPNQGKNAHYPPSVSRNSTFVSVPDFTYEEFVARQEEKIKQEESC